jgi:hypothetical protein
MCFAQLVILTFGVIPIERTSVFVHCCCHMNSVVFVRMKRILSSIVVCVYVGRPRQHKAILVAQLNERLHITSDGVLSFSFLYRGCLIHDLRPFRLKYLFTSFGYPHETSNRHAKLRFYRSFLDNTGMDLK